MFHLSSFVCGVRLHFFFYEKKVMCVVEDSFFANFFSSFLVIKESIVEHTLGWLHYSNQVFKERAEMSFFPLFFLSCFSIPHFQQYTKKG